MKTQAVKPDVKLRNRRESGVLLFTIFLIAVCGLLYELVIGSLSAYLLGDSVSQFSITIGVYLSAMGVGSFLSRLIRRRLLETFLAVEVLIGVLGGGSAVALLALHAWYEKGYVAGMILILGLLGCLIGLEIPLLTRMAKRYGSLRETVANVLGFDYLGALLASIAFPFLLLPGLGPIKTALFVGMVNVAVAGINLWVFRSMISRRQQMVWASPVVMAVMVLLGGFYQATAAVSFFEHRLYQGEIIHTVQSRYQRVVMTYHNDDLRLYLDGELQFSSRDEYRYHEALVHPAMSVCPRRESVLVIGGGDGLAVREILKYPEVRQVVLVDLDPAVTTMARTFGPLVRLNQRSLLDPRVRVINGDGFRFIVEANDCYPVIFIDLPDPRNENLSRLYSREFYGCVQQRLARGGVMVTQSSSPYFVRQAFWAIVKTVRAAGMDVIPYHTYVPAFGDWGFVMASPLKLDWSRCHPPPSCRYLTTEVLRQMTQFDRDTSEVDVKPGSMTDPTVWRYYARGWGRWTK